jgi:hypothetical protein
MPQHVAVQLLLGYVRLEAGEQVFCGAGVSNARCIPGLATMTQGKDLQGHCTELPLRAQHYELQGCSKVVHISTQHRAGFSD